MCYQQDACAGVTAVIREQCFGGKSGLHIHGGSRLVKDEQLIIAHQKTREGHPGGFAAGEPLGGLTGQCVDLQSAEKCFPPFRIAAVQGEISCNVHAEGIAFLGHIADPERNEGRTLLVGTL